MSDVDNIEFGEYIREARKNLNYKIRQIETMTGISNGYLSQIENGKVEIPSPAILKKLAPILNMSYEDLMQKAGYFDHGIFLVPSKEEGEQPYDNMRELQAWFKEPHIKTDAPSNLKRLVDALGNLSFDDREIDLIIAVAMEFKRKK
jgi:transcriptional regulator with XRE-family HTH domain